MTFRNIQVVLTGNATPLQTALRVGASEVDRFAGRANKSLGTIGKGTAVAGVLTLAAGLAASIHEAAAFEKSMRNVNSISKLTDSQFKTLSQTVIDMSKHSTQSAKTLADGLYDISSSGFQGAQGIQVLQASAKAASAGLSDTATAARAITATLNAYGLESGAAADVSDTLFQTVNLGVVSFDELASQIGDVVGMASAAKIPIADVGSAVAAMTLSGISAAESTTSLSRVIQGIIQPSDKLASLMSQLGYESGAQALETDGLYKVMNKLRESTGGTATAYLELFPEIRAARGAFALAANDGQNYAETQDGIADASNRAGATQAALNEQLKSVSAQWDIAVNKAQAYGIELGGKILPTLAAVIHGAVSFGGQLSNAMGDAADAVAPLFANLVSIGADLFTIFGHLMSVVGPLVGALAALAATGVLTILEGMAAATEKVTSVLADSAPLTLGLAAALAVMLIPLSAVTFAFNSWVATPVVLAINGIIGGIGSLIGWLEALTVAEAAATLGASAIIGLAVGLGVHFYNAGKKAEDQANKTAAAIASLYNPSGAQNWADLERGAEAAADALANDLGVEVTKVGDKLQWINSLDHPIDGNKLTANTGEIARIDKDLETLRTTIDKVGGALGLNRDQVIRLANKYGVDLHDGAAKVTDALSGVVTSSLEGTSAFGNLRDAATDLGSGVASADDKLKDLKATFDSIIGVNLDAQAALDAYRQKLDDLAQSFADNGRGLDEFTAKGRANRAAIRDSISAINDHVEALQKQGATGPQLKAAFDAEYEGLVRTMQASGMTRDSVVKLLATYGLVPADITTFVEAAGATDAQKQVKGVHGELNALPDQTTPRVDVAGAAEGDYAVRVLQGDIRALENRTVYVTTVIQSVQAGQTSLRAAENQLGIGEFAGGGAAAAPAPVVHVGTPKISSPGAVSGRTGQSGGSGGGGASKAAQAAQDAAEARARIAANKEEFYFDKLSTASQIKNLTQKMSKTKQFTDEWMDLYHKRADLIKSQADERANLAANKAEWSYEHMSTENQIKELNRRLVHTKTYTDAWLDLLHQRAAAQEELNAIKAHIAANKADYLFSKLTAEHQLQYLDALIKKEQKYSDRWIELTAQREAIAETQAEEAKNRQQEQLDALNAMLDAQEEIQGRIRELEAKTAEVRSTFLQEEAAAQQKYTDDIAAAQDALRKTTAQLLADRQKAVNNWMRLDAQMADRRGFLVTSDDEAGARAALKAAGLLTEAMAAWDESQQGAMSASTIAQNARDQAEIIRQWQSGLSALRARGLSAEVISALGLDDSPEALAQVRAFADATDAEIADLNSAVAEKTAAAGAVVAQEQAGVLGALGAGLTDAQGVFNQAVADAQDELNNSMAEASKKLADALADINTQMEQAKDDLGKIGTEQGRTYSEALAAGIASGLPAVEAAARALQAAVVMNPTRLPGNMQNSGTTPSTATPGSTPGNTGTAAGAPAASNYQAYLRYAAAVAEMWSVQLGVNKTPDDVLVAGGPWKFDPGLSTAVYKNMTESVLESIPTFTRTYDSGGVLSPGVTTAHNLTGQDEYVLTLAQLRAFGTRVSGSDGAAAQPINVEYTIDARGAVDGVASQIQSALEQHTTDLVGILRAGSRN